jgi:hypothetical protein
MCSLILPVNDTPLESVLTTLKGIAAHIPPELFELLLVNAATDEEARARFAALAEEVRIISAPPGASFSVCCNLAAQEARGKYLVFLKPGLIPCPGWLEGLVTAAEEGPMLGYRRTGLQ